jgi:TRAP transporter TAXI family solute receptor
VTDRNPWQVLHFSAVAGLALLLTACSPEPPALTIGSGGSLGNYYSAARSIARVVNKQREANGFSVAYTETSGSVANIEALMSGDTQFGIAQADIVYQTVNGLGDWSERGPQSELRAVFSLYSDVITVVATPKSGIKSTRDLIGKRIDIGHPDSGARRNAIEALDALGVDWRTGTTIHGESPTDRATMYLHGNLDAFFHTVGHPTTDIKFAVTSVPGARFVSLDNINELLEQHRYYSRSMIPVGLYPDVENTEYVESVGVKVIFVTSATVPEEAVYRVTREVFEHIESLGKFDPVLKGLTKEGMVESLIAPLHPGASRYYEEVGLRSGS